MSWVRNFTHSGWTSRLLEWNPEGNPFPSPEDDTDPFVTGITQFPARVALIGVAAACLTLLRLCYWHTSPEDVPRRRNSSVWPSLGLAFASCVLVAGGLAYFQTHARRGELVFAAVFADAADDVSQAASIGLDLNSTGTVLLSQLHEMPTLCPLMQPIVEEQVAPLKANVERYMADVRRYNAMIGPIPGRLQSLDSDGVMDKGQDMLFVALAVPLLLVGGACITMVVVVLGAACFRKGSCVSQCEEYFMTGCASLLMAMIITLVAAISAGQLSVAIGLSVFCADADANFMKVLARDLAADLGINSSTLASHRDTLVTTAQFYVTGEGPNPILERVLQAHEALDSCGDSLDEMSLYSTNPVILMTCDGDVFSAMLDDINASLAEARTEVHSCEVLLEPSNLYPYYEAAVHEEACGAIIDGFAWLAVIQSVVGVMLLPFLVCSSAGYVRQQAFVRKAKTPQEVTLELQRKYMRGD